MFSFFEWLKTSSVKQIIKLIGIRYRKHYKTNCRGMDWRIKLRCLQAIACCLGGDKLVRIELVTFIHHYTVVSYTIYL